MKTDHSPADRRDGRGLTMPARVALVTLGFSSVASLLGWVYGIASFSVLFRFVTVPGVIALLAIAVWSSTGDHSNVHQVIKVGAIAGLIGTVGYDLFRIPFIYGGGFLLLSPIESYGVLATGANTSNGWTDFIGWAYHFSNGIGFGIAYAALAMHRRWGWGVVYAMALETATVVTPFASAYQLSGKYFVIGVAYAAHVPYGLALGKLSQDPERTMHHLGILGRRTASTALVATTIGLALWLRPWSLDPDIERGRQVADGPSMIIQAGRVSPEFVVLKPGECATILNSDQEVRGVKLEGVDTAVDANRSSSLCPTDTGVHHIRSDAGPFKGGFLIVDPES